ncbi:MAG: hypothetical protein ACLFO6_06020 [Archaeoglobaceae archaeon]
MPSLETHSRIAELLGVDSTIFKGVNEIVVSDKSDKEQWKRTLELIKVKNTSSSTDKQKVKELIKNNWWSAKCQKDIPCFFFKAQTAYDNFGVDGLRAYFLYHTIEYADWWQNPPEPYFLLKVRKQPEMTRKEERKLLSYIKQKLFKYQEFSLRPVSSDINLVCYHLLDKGLFDISGSFEELNVKYRFNERTESFMKDVFSQVKNRFSEILEVIYKDAPEPEHLKS